MFRLDPMPTIVNIALWAQLDRARVMCVPPICTGGERIDPWIEAHRLSDRVGDKVIWRQAKIRDTERSCGQGEEVELLHRLR